MIKVAKSNTAPKSLTKTKAYDGEDVKRQLHVDQHSKCYICERILSTDFQVEHLRSKENFPDKIQDWNNLLLSCSYCNQKKLHHYDDILDPTKDDIECIVKQEIDFANRLAKFTALDARPETSKTVELLSKIYNGTYKCKKTKEELFFKEILADINNFSKIILDFIIDPSEDNETVVKNELQITKENLGFKYWVIKSNEQLAKTFANDIVWNK